MSGGHQQVFEFVDHGRVLQIEADGWEQEGDAVVFHRFWVSGGEGTKLEVGRFPDVDRRSVVRFNP
jgi:hypothetical protein